MRVRPAALAACALAAAHVWCGTALAHVLPQPQFVVAGGVSTLSLAGPNERDAQMTGLSVTVPEGLRIVAARDVGAWRATVDERSAIWTGGSLAPMAEASFELELDVSAEPGTLVLETTQLYPDGQAVPWPVSVTVLPAPGEAPGQNLGWALAAGGAGLVVTAGLAVLAWRRRSRSLQER